MLLVQLLRLLWFAMVLLHDVTILWLAARVAPAPLNMYVQYVPCCFVQSTLLLITVNELKLPKPHGGDVSRTFTRSLITAQA